MHINISMWEFFNFFFFFLVNANSLHCLTLPPSYKGSSESLHSFVT